MKLTELLDQIDRLDGELLPGWKYNDRTGAVIANAYRKQGDKWSCLVAKDIPADCDAEFIALARTALPQLAKAVKNVLEFLKHRAHPSKTLDPTGEFGAILDAYDRTIRQAITDALGDDDA